MRRQTLKTDAVQRLVDACFRPSPDGLVPNVHKGAVPAQAQSVARYVATYVVSPPISVRRMDRYDGERVTYHYRSHRTDRMEHETVTADMCIGRMVQHVMPKGFKRMRYDGVQATKTFAKVKVVIQAALAKVEGVIKGAVKIIARLTLPATVRAEHGARSLPLSPLWCRDGGVARLAPNLWSDL
jgi:hypothetical protein